MSEVGTCPLALVLALAHKRMGKLIIKECPCLSAMRKPHPHNFICPPFPTHQEFFLSWMPTTPTHLP